MCLPVLSWGDRVRYYTICDNRVSISSLRHNLKYFVCPYLRCKGRLTLQEGIEARKFSTLGLVDEMSHGVDGKESSTGFLGRCIQSSHRNSYICCLSVSKMHNERTKFDFYIRIFFITESRVRPFHLMLLEHSPVEADSVYVCVCVRFFLWPTVHSQVEASADN